MSENTNNIPFEIDRYEPVGWLFFRKLNFSTIGILILAWVYGIFEGIILPLIENYEPLFADLFWYAIIMPTIWVYFSLSRTRIPQLFSNIDKKELLKDFSKDENAETIDKLQHSYNKLLWILLALIGAVIITSVIVFVVWSVYPPPYIAAIPHKILGISLILINAYLGTMVLVREFITIYWLNSLFKIDSIQIHPLHPDGAGGLGFIGKYYVGLTSMVVVIVLWLGLWSFIVPIIEGEPFRLGMPEIIGWLLYITITPTSFFFPLWSVHNAMKRTKNALLQEISNQFDSDFKLARTSINKGTDILSNNINKVKSLEDMDEFISRTYPTWPFNSRTLQRFSVSASLPVVLSLIPVLIDFLFNSNP